MNRELLTKLRDVIEDIKKLPLHTTWVEAERAKEPGVYLSNFQCGQTYCVLGWAVQEPEFAPFIVHHSIINTIEWFKTYVAVTEALGIPHEHGGALFGSVETLDERLNLIKEILNEDQ